MLNVPNIKLGLSSNESSFWADPSQTWWTASVTRPVTHVRLWRVCTRTFHRLLSVGVQTPHQTPHIVPGLPCFYIYWLTNTKHTTVYIHLRFQSNNIISVKNVHSKCASFTSAMKYVIVSYQVRLKDEGPSPDQDIRSNTFLCGAVGGQEIVTNLRALTLWMFSTTLDCSCVHTGKGPRLQSGIV